MCTIEIYEWRPNCKKVSHTVLLQDRLGLSLSAAKELTDAVLANCRPKVTLKSEAEARSLVAALDALGFSARLTG